VIGKWLAGVSRGPGGRVSETWDASNDMVEEKQLVEVIRVYSAASGNLSLRKFDVGNE